MNERGGFVYILTNNWNKVLYVGVTADLVKRIFRHKMGLGGGFTKKYGTNKLVYYEKFDDIVKAIEREKQLKNWRREWKIKLVESVNLKWTEISVGS